MYNIFLPVLQFSPVSIIQPLLHTHSSNYHAFCIIFSTSTSIFPLSVSCHHCSIHIHPHTTHNVWSFSPSTSGFSCQYHSTISQYSFIHLPPTLYNVFLPGIQFSLSVSFHHCSIPIHPPSTHTIMFFSQYFSIPPVSNIPPLFHTHKSTCHPHSIIFFSHYFYILLSVSLHHFSILIHPPTTHSV